VGSTHSVSFTEPARSAEPVCELRRESLGDELRDALTDPAKPADQFMRFGGKGTASAAPPTALRFEETHPQVLLDRLQLMPRRSIRYVETLSRPRQRTRFTDRGQQIDTPFRKD